MLDAQNKRQMDEQCYIGRTQLSVYTGVARIDFRLVNY